MTSRTLRCLGSAVFILSLALTSGCGDDDDQVRLPVASRYTITVTNLTNNQPLSPPAAILHGNGYTGWNVGTAASGGLEQLAEGGDPAGFIAEADMQASVDASSAGTGVILPGASDEVTVSAAISGDHRLTLATMLVNTNDAFTGFTNLQVGGLGVSERLMTFTHAYDAGTEANSETSGTVPGPAGGGEGFNASRDDLADFVAGHRGVVTLDDGLAESALDESHRFVNPVAKVVIRRVR